MTWISTSDRLPHDLKQKLVIAYNTFQDRSFYALAYFDPRSQSWGKVGGRVLYWMDLPKKPEEEDHEMDKR